MPISTAISTPATITRRRPMGPESITLATTERFPLYGGGTGSSGATLGAAALTSATMAGCWFWCRTIGADVTMGAVARTGGSVGGGGALVVRGPRPPDVDWALAVAAAVGGAVGGG